MVLIYIPKQKEEEIKRFGFAFRSIFKMSKTHTVLLFTNEIIVSIVIPLIVILIIIKSDLIV